MMMRIAVASTLLTTGAMMVTAEDSPPPRIAWYGTLQDGFAAARESGRPILLVSAAPHCHDVSGIW
jgi:hypothetical protein